jgi:hypothetical protein
MGSHGNRRDLEMGVCVQGRLSDEGHDGAASPPVVSPEHATAGVDDDLGSFPRVTKEHGLGHERLRVGSLGVEGHEKRFVESFRLRRRARSALARAAEEKQLVGRRTDEPTNANRSVIGLDLAAAEMRVR